MDDISVQIRTKVLSQVSSHLQVGYPTIIPNLQHGLTKVNPTVHDARGCNKRVRVSVATQCTIAFRWFFCRGLMLPSYSRVPW